MAQQALQVVSFLLPPGAGAITIGIANHLDACSANTNSPSCATGAGAAWVYKNAELTGFIVACLILLALVAYWVSKSSSKASPASEVAVPLEPATNAPNTVPMSTSNPATLLGLRTNAAGPEDVAPVVRGRELMASGAYEEAAELLLVAVRVPATREDARAAIVELFNILGPDHEVVRQYRSRLAAALF